MRDLLRYRVFNSVLGFQIEDADLAHIVERVFVDVPPTEDAADAVIRVVKLSDGEWDITGPTGWAGVALPHEIIPRLVTIANLFALDHADERLCLHGATVVVDGRASCLVASSGVGKTTLAVALLSAGAMVSSDEMIRLSSDGCEVDAWPKPLSVKPGTAELFPELLPLMVDDGVDFRQVPLSAVGKVSFEPAPVRGVLLLKRGTHGQIIEPLHPTAALVGLIPHTMNFEVVGPRNALGTLAALVARNPSESFAIQSPAESADVVLEWIDSVEHDVMEWTLHDSTSAYAHDGVLTVEIDGCVALWSPETKRAVALERTGSRMWLAASAGESDELLDYPDFVRSLVDAGFLDLERTLAAIRARA